MELRVSSRVTFGECSSVKLIRKLGFLGARVGEICIPDRVEVVPCDAGPRYTWIDQAMPTPGNQLYVNRFYLRTDASYL